MINASHHSYIVTNPNSFSLALNNIFLTPWCILKHEFHGRYALKGFEFQVRDVKWIEINRDNAQVNEVTSEAVIPRWLKIALSIALLLPSLALVLLFPCSPGLYNSDPTRTLGAGVWECFASYLKDEEFRKIKAHQEMLARALVTSNFQSQANVTDANNTLQGLPKDVRLHILTYVVGKNLKQRALLSSTCKSFYHEANSFPIWKSLIAQMNIGIPANLLSIKDDNEKLKLIKKWFVIEEKCTPFIKTINGEFKNFFPNVVKFESLPIAWFTGKSVSWNSENKSGLDSRRMSIRLAIADDIENLAKFPVVRGITEDGFSFISVMCQGKAPHNREESTILLSIYPFLGYEKNTLFYSLEGIILEKNKQVQLMPMIFPVDINRKKINGSKEWLLDLFSQKQVPLAQQINGSPTSFLQIQSTADPQLLI